MKLNKRRWSKQLQSKVFNVKQIYDITFSFFSVIILQGSSEKKNLKLRKLLKVSN